MLETADGHEVDETERGRVVWHSSEEGSGPDVGLTIGLGGGRSLWFGEIVSTRFAVFADEHKDHQLGNDDGWWMILYGKARVDVLAKFGDAYAAQEFADVLAAALASAPSPQGGDNE